MATLSFRNIQKVYDNKVQAVFDFNLEVKDKEFIVFVGPSGCGKSTTLRMIAGLEEITEGELYIDDVLVNEVEPKNRDIAMVFQSYALYPHMSVYDNMAFALQLRKMPKDEIDKRVQHAAEILGLTPYLHRKPKALSGGQRQRVALGRSIVRSPKVFLMDEPLSNLDAKLRVQMRSEIASIHKKVGATTIYVTHDQTEAMTMADRIVVMKDGYIQQIGTPKEVYNVPANMFVASFIGSPSMNFIHCLFNGEKLVIQNETTKELSEEIHITDEEKKHLKEYGTAQIPVTKELIVQYDDALKEVDSDLAAAAAKRRKKEIQALEAEKKELEERQNGVRESLSAYEKGEFEVVIGIRPEDVSLKNENAAADSQNISLKAEVVELLGNELVIYGDMNGQRIIAKASADNNVECESVHEYTMNMKKIHFFDAKTTRRI